MTLKFATRMGAVLSSALLGSHALAQSITYAPASTSVPTVSEWGLMLMSVVLAVAAWLVLRRQNSKALMAWAMVASLALAIGGSGRWISEAWAIPSPSMTNNNGGTLDLSVFSGGGEFPINGNQNIPMRIVDLTPTSLSTTGTPTCAVGLVVPYGGVCYVRFNSCGLTTPGALSGAAC